MRSDRRARTKSIAVFCLQAKDGMRDVAVTGVQTCALPISTTRSPDQVRPLAPSNDTDPWPSEKPSTWELGTMVSVSSALRSALWSSARCIGSAGAPYLDRKSTRLNSSHGYISYAVFCLKKQ